MWCSSTYPQLHTHSKKAQPYGCAFLLCVSFFQIGGRQPVARLLYWRPYTVERYIIPSVTKLTAPNRCPSPCRCATSPRTAGSHPLQRSLRCCNRFASLAKGGGCELASRRRDWTAGASPRPTASKTKNAPCKSRGDVIIHSLFCAQQCGVFPWGHTESALKQGDKMRLGGEAQAVTHLLGGAALPQQGFG